MMENYPQSLRDVLKSQTSNSKIVIPANTTQSADLLGSLLLFTQTFFELRTGRKYVISQPAGREAHQVQISRAFTKIFNLDTERLLINIAPGHGKSELCRHFVAWALAHYPDSNFLYISYSHERASDSTAVIRDIINMPLYKKLFGITISEDFNARDKFKTNKGGMVVAFGSGGSITGADGGLPGLDRFSGAIIMDDMHKPDEAHSDSMREAVITNYLNTIIHRSRGKNVPFVFIGQRLREDDLPDYFIKRDPHKWDKLILKSIDDANNVLYPEEYSLDRLLLLKETSPYDFAAQHQQDPLPAGGGLFAKEWFISLEEEPNILTTFITADTAETDKTYNDATVFSFWGVYKIHHFGEETNLYGLHWLDCKELRVEPKDLKNEFISFYTECMRFRVKPKMAAIEKKSTGVTLSSILKDMQGLQIIDIDRTKASNCKTTRYIEMQPYISDKRVTLPKYGRHNQLCIEHMRKITANNSHRFDDICDTVYDAVKIALIDKSILGIYNLDEKKETNEIVKKIAVAQSNLISRRKVLWQR